jgi:ankyrin repeat protein
MYEVESAALLFLQAINKGQRFDLAMNMKSARPFDDIVFIHKVRNESKAYFFQLKHKENRDYIIKRKSLLQVSGDFSLLKFYKSYYDIKYSWAENTDLRFCGDFCNFEFIICTNVELENQSNYQHDNEGILNSGGTYFSFNSNTASDIYGVFEGWKHFCGFLEAANECDVVRKTNEFKKMTTNTTILEQLEMCKSAKDIMALKEKLGDLSLYKEFLNKLKMYTGHVSGEKLKLLIKEQIEIAFGTSTTDTDPVFREFRSQIMTWWDKKHNFINESANFWKNITQNRISAIKRMSHTKICELDSLNVKFNENTVATLNRAISSERAVHIVPKGNETVLSTLKVYQAAEGGQFGIFVITDLDNLLTHEDAILKIWETVWCECLILEQGKETGDNVRKLCENITKILKKHITKKLILIGIESCSVSLSLKSENTLSVINDNCSLKHFSTDSENLLLSREIDFQGYVTTLGSLLNPDGNLNSLVCNDFLCLLVKREKIKIGKELAKKIDCYVPRTLKHQIFVNNNSKLVNDQSSGYVLAISGMSQEDLHRLILPSGNNTIPTAKWPFCPSELTSISSRIIEFRDFDREGAFQKLSAAFDCIHWFHNRDGQLIWKASRGNMDIVYQHLDSSILQNYKAENFTDIDDKVVLIAAKPGMGKSTLLTHLAAGTKQLDPSIWIVRVDLNDHTNFLYSVNEGMLGVDTVTKFLKEGILKLGNCVESEFEEQLFEDSLMRRGNLVIMFDGYDEISPSYTRKVSVMLKELQKVIAGKLWVTTRTIMRHRLEDDLSTVAFTLHPFRQSEQHTFLQQVWKSKIPNIPRNVLKEFVTKLLQLTTQSLSDEEKEFTGIPLQTMMLAEVFENDLRHCSQTGIIDFPPALNLLQLYDEFVKRKLDIYYKEKRKTDMTNAGVQDDLKEFCETFMRNHMRCGVIAVCPPETVELLEGFQYPKPSFMKKVASGKEKTGILEEIIDGKPHFIHKTFAEYFAAHWFSRNYRGNQKVLRDIIFSPCYDVMKNILDRILSNEKVLHMAVLNGDIEAVETALCNNVNVNDVDRGGRSALHLAVGHGKGPKVSKSSSLFYSSYIYTDTEEETSADCITQLLLEHSADVNIQDIVLGWTPLQYADKFRNNFRTLGMLLEHGANEELLSFSKKKFKNKNYIEENISVAIEQGYINLISYICKNGHKINIRLPCDNCRYSIQYSTVLHKAVLGDRLQVACVLVDNGADVNMKDSEGNTALHLAAKEGKVDAVRFLVERESSISASNNKGDTPLHVAAKNGKFEIVKYLVKKGADVNKPNKRESGETALHVAVCEDSLEIVKYLCENGGQKVCNRNEYSDVTPLHLAASAGKLEIVKYLAGRVDHVDICDQKGNTPLHYAVSEMVSYNSDVIRCLVELGADIHQGNRCGETPLHLAVENGKLEMLKYFDERGANFDLQNANGCSLLHCAAKETNLEIVEYVAKRCVNIDAVDSKGETPVMYAAHKGSLSIVKYLIDVKNANAYMRNKNGDTLLHCAVRSGQQKLVSYLFHRYRKLDRRNKNGETAVLTAAVSRQWEIVILLAEEYAYLCGKNDGMTVLCKASEQDNHEVLAKLLKKAFIIRRRTKDGNTLVHIACKNGALDVLKFFAEIGVNFDVRNLLQDSPLHFAVLNDHEHIVKYLLEKNVKVNQQNNQGMSPLLAAVSKGSLRLVKLLVDVGGADVTLRDINRRTPLYIALESKNKELVEYLAVRSSSCKVSLNIALEMAVWTNLWDLVPCLLDSGANVNAQNACRLTALHRTAGMGELDVAVNLLNRRANVNQKDFYGITPLLYAAFNGHYDMVWHLVQNGANVRHRDNMGNTALHCAASFGNVSIMRYLVMYLISHKATDVVWAKNKRKMTALDVAIKERHVSVENCLKSVIRLKNDAVSSHTISRHNGCSGKKPAQYMSSKCYVRNKGIQSSRVKIQSKEKNIKESCTPLFSEKVKKQKDEQRK